MRSSFQAFHDETQPLRLLGEEPRSAQSAHRAFAGAVLGLLVALVPILAVLAL